MEIADPWSFFTIVFQYYKLKDIFKNNSELGILLLPIALEVVFPTSEHSRKIYQHRLQLEPFYFPSWWTTVTFHWLFARGDVRISSSKMSEMKHDWNARENLLRIAASNFM